MGWTIGKAAVRLRADSHIYFFSSHICAGRGGGGHGGTEYACGNEYPDGTFPVTNARLFLSKPGLSTCVGTSCSLFILGLRGGPY